MPKRI